jgi:hypothetical protein
MLWPATEGPGKLSGTQQHDTSRGGVRLPQVRQDRRYPDHRFEVDRLRKRNQGRASVLVEAGIADYYEGIESMKGLSFSEPMIRAWMAGNKSVTRRLMNPQPDGISGIGDPFIYIDDSRDRRKAIIYRYLPGETVYIKETWRIECIYGEINQVAIEYKDGQIRRATPSPGWIDRQRKRGPSAYSWRSPMMMPEWASRSHALIVSVRPERVQEITLTEIEKEGFTGELNTAFSAFIGLWDSMHGAQNFHIINPWVWRIELEKLP